MTLRNLQKKKNNREKISMITAYDVWSARLIEATSVDCILIGDSLSMVMHGFEETVHATTPMMELHVAAVKRSGTQKLLIADMPFASFRKGKKYAVETATRLIQAGAQAVKLEGINGHQDVITHLIGSGIPVMGHLGLTPQFVHSLGGHRVQGRSDSQAEQLFDDALRLQELGCFALVLECIPQELAKKVSQELKIPVIGIGAGADVDGQVLVLHDLLGLSGDFQPKFLRRYLNGGNLILEAIENYSQDVKSGRFPSPEESYE